MAYDEGLAQLLRDDLGPRPGLTETRMFGGLCFLLDGHMLCGVYAEKNGGHAMYRVGKSRTEAALALPGTAPMALTGRPMGGVIDADGEALEDGTRLRLLALALENVASLPPRRPARLP